MTIVVAPAKVFTPSAPVAEDVYGDNDATLYGSARNQRFVLEQLGHNVFGDSYTLAGSATGGRDTMVVTGFGGVSGDTAYVVGSSRGGNDTLRVTAGAFEDGHSFGVAGDTGYMHDRALGGNDSITAKGFVVVAGDAAATMAERTRGGNDTIHVIGDGESEVLGDARTLRDHARGGNDRITFEGEAFIVAGDARYLFDDSVGGNDRITVAGAALFPVVGDALTLVYFSTGYDPSGTARGGNDHLVSTYAGGSAMAGDATLISGLGRGGNDTLIGGDGADTLWGDAGEMQDQSIGGSDVLAGGRGDDLLYGDAETFSSTGARGADRFVFAAASGSDTIGDFTPGQDRIDVSALGIVSSAGFASFTDDNADTTIVFSAGNQVLVQGVTTAQLAAGDFIFA